MFKLFTKITAIAVECAELDRLYLMSERKRETSGLAAAATLRRLAQRSTTGIFRGKIAKPSMSSSGITY